jgi:hypothetical protein
MDKNAGRNEDGKGDWEWEYEMGKPKRVQNQKFKSARNRRGGSGTEKKKYPRILVDNFQEPVHRVS